MGRGAAERTELMGLAQKLGMREALGSLTFNELREAVGKKVQATLEERGIREGVTIKYSDKSPKWRSLSFPVLSTEVKWSEAQPQIELNKPGQRYSVMLILQYATVVNSS